MTDDTATQAAASTILDADAPESREFELIDLISVASGIVIAGDTPALLSFMSGYNIWLGLATPIGRYAKAFQPELLRQHPWLAELASDYPVDVAGWELRTEWPEWEALRAWYLSPDFATWYGRMVAKHGLLHAVQAAHQIKVPPRLYG